MRHDLSNRRLYMRQKELFHDVTRGQDGNVSYTDLASDLPTVFTMLWATFHLTDPNGSRSVVASNFFTDLFKAALDENEILTAIEVPAEATNSGSAYTKMANKTSRHTVIGAAASVTAGMNGD